MTKYFLYLHFNNSNCKTCDLHFETQWFPRQLKHSFFRFTLFKLALTSKTIVQSKHVHQCGRCMDIFVIVTCIVCIGISLCPSKKIRSEMLRI